MQQRLVVYFENLIGTGFFVPDYSIMMALALVIGLHLALYSANREGLAQRKVFFCYVATFGFALIAARVFSVLRHLSYFVANPEEIICFWKGGLASSGAIIGGLGAAVLLAGQQQLPRATFFDCCAPSVALTIALGRIGCFFNGCCYGGRTEIFWAMRFPKGSGPHYAHLQSGLIRADQLSLPVHPTQLYEAAYAFIVLLVLLKWRPRLCGTGRLFALLFVLYPLGRFANEFLRVDDRLFVFGLSFPQWLALASIAAAVLFFAKQTVQAVRKKQYRREKIERSAT